MYQNNCSCLLLGLTRVPIYYICLQMLFNYIYYFISVVKMISLNNCRVIFLNNCTDYVIFLVRYFNGFPRGYKKKLKFTCKILLFYAAVASFYFGSLYGRIMHQCFPGGTSVKNQPAIVGDAKDACSIPGLGRSPGEGNSNLLQYYCLGNPMNRGAWQAIVNGVAKSWTWLST